MSDMENYLKEINAVVGVVGSFVCLPDGSVPAKAMPDQFEPKNVETAARAAIQTFNALDGSGQRIVEADLVFAQGRLVMKNLRGGILVMVCARTINLPLLNLTANVAAKKIAAEFKPKTASSQKPATEHAKTNAAAGATSRAPAEHAHVTPKLATPAVSTVTPSAPNPAPAEEIAPSPLYIELEEEAHRLQAAAKSSQTTLCTLDPIAVWACCPETRQLVSQPKKRHLDFCAPLEQAPVIKRLFGQMGYELNQRFDSIHGNERLHFDDTPRYLSTDVYLNAFAMYHRLDLKPLLATGAELVTETYLVLIRLQVVETAEADIRDLCALFLEHTLTYAPEKESINATQISRLCADDWGWYKTVTTNLDRLIEYAENNLAPASREIVATRAGQLRSGIERAPKSLRWMARAGIGESVRWYETPVTVSQSRRPDLSMA